MYVPHMAEDIEARIGDLPEIDSVSVETVADKVWTQDRMTPAAAKERQKYFTERIEAHDVTPAYDGEAWSDEIGLDGTEGTNG
jgi:metal-sulfur cluster biosynthetic enzyme